MQIGKGTHMLFLNIQQWDHHHRRKSGYEYCTRRILDLQVYDKSTQVKINTCYNLRLG